MMVRHKRYLIAILRKHFGKDWAAKNRFTFAEIGVFTGHVSAELLKTFPKVQVYMIDPWESFRHKGPHMMSAVLLDALWHTEFAAKRRAVFRQTSEQALGSFDDDELDVAYIDGNHYYEYVSFDVPNWYRKVRPGGILCGHDYGGQPDYAVCGVKKAVDEFVEQKGLELRLDKKSTIWWIVK